MPIKVLSHLGHCIDYNLVCEIETAEAEIALQWLAEHEISSLQQDHEDSDVQRIVFWWFDNFNQKLDSASGYGTIDATHIVKFKEKVDVSNAHQLQSDPSNTSINRTKRRSLQNIGAVLPSLSINKNKEPSIVSQEMGEAQKLTEQEEKETFYYIHQLWYYLRFLASKDQMLPTFSGWCVSKDINYLRVKNEQVEKTSMIYLPPVNSPITEFSTIKKVFEILIDRAKRANMLYINVTLDVGGALKEYKVLWNFQDEFKSIFIHLGDFHFMKECLNFLGCLISGSSFEDIVHQAELCSPGSLNGVISGSHYNRCWTVHANFAEALERLLFQRFLKTYSEIESAVDDDLQNIDQSKLENIEINSKTEKILDAYSKFKQAIRDGKYGKTTSQFCVVMYLDVTRDVYLLHRAVQENTFFLGLFGWKQLVPLAFALNKTNYARYGSTLLRIWTQHIQDAVRLLL